jgi:hypothetical protein
MGFGSKCQLAFAIIFGHFFMRHPLIAVEAAADCGGAVYQRLRGILGLFTLGFRVGAACSARPRSKWCGVS